MHTLALHCLHLLFTLRTKVLYKIVGLLRSAFGGHFNEEGVRNNYILIYELLDGTIQQ